MWNFTKKFTEINKKDVTLAGGKGASLGEMAQAGMPIPSGFIILSTAFDQFIKESDLIQEIDSALYGVDHREIHTVENVSEKIQGLIKNVTIPENIVDEIKKQFKELDAKFVAVRSSATAEDGTENAWAGQLDSFLNTKEENLLENIQKCWASLFTPRAIFYRFEKGLHTTKISVAVVVQKMVDSEISGVAFSVHPVTEDKNQIVIEAGFGLGEAIVSGQITPNSYVVEKEPREIIDTNISTQTRGLYRAETGGNEWLDISEPKASSQVLTEAQILELADLIIKIENHYDFPCDIEWALEGGNFYILQSRPITTLLKEKPNQKSQNGFWKKTLTTIFGPRKIIFEKITRDTTYIMQEMWPYGCSEAVEKEYGWKNPYTPIIINYMSQGSIEVWENVRATRWLSSTILKKNSETSEFMDEVLKKYKEKLSAIHKLWEEKMLSIEKIKKLIEISKETMAYYIPYYYSTLDDRTPKNVMDKAIEMRNEDDFFAKNDIVIRNSLISLYPELKGLETTIFFDELDSIPDIDILKKRREHFLAVQGAERLMITLDEFNKLHPNFIFKKDVVSGEGSNEIRGEIAQKGRVTGKVKILRRREQVGEVMEGDVIVSPMTTTDFLPAVLKAGAIITDEGGITSHAAITARELKKPCIIGTRIATQILKDGDIVEVDANKGVVKILERL
ncbi:MAG: PEP/pyruvate-binding domain-containing protein [Candidatus Paceibacterota bacterium]|jgi:phosphoenolpyruvate synthase/pyruvate phosphate dikinase